MALYASFQGPKYDSIFDWIGKGKKILDVGCGAGAFSARLSRDNQVTGVEFSEENYAKAKELVPVLKGDFLTMDIPERYDIVLFGDVLEHMYEPEKALRKACRLADEIILCVPNFDCVFARGLRMVGITKTKTGILDETHVFPFNRRTIEEMLGRVGLEIVEGCSPRPRKLPPPYQRLVNFWPEFFGIQFLYRCRPKA